MSLAKFLMLSLESKVTLTQHQILLLTGRFEVCWVFKEASRVGWRVFDLELVNDVWVFHFSDNRQVCICGQAAQHHHDGFACCGSVDCCPQERNLEFETASLVAEIRSNLVQR